MNRIDFAKIMCIVQFIYWSLIESTFIKLFARPNEMNGMGNETDF